MPNEKHIKWLLEGKDTWNKRRETQTFCPHFSFADIFEELRSSKKLDNNGRVNLKGFNLCHAVFNGANLSRVDFDQANLREANIIGVRLEDTSFSEADLSNANFGVSYLGRANFSCAILEDTDLVDQLL